MTPEAAWFLVLAAALGHAVWNAIVKASGDRLLVLAAIRAVGLLFGLALLPFVPTLPAAALPALAAAVAAHGLYYVLLLRAYAGGDLGVVHPLSRGLAPLLLAGAAWLAVDERLGPGAMAGLLLTSSGVALLALRAGADAATVRLSAAVGATIAAYSFFGAVGVRTAGSVLAFQAWLEILTGVGVLGWTAAVRGRADVLAYVRRSGGIGALAGMISVGGYLAYLAAAAMMPMAAVAAVRESSALFSAVIGAVILREPFGRHRIAAAALVTGGVVALGVLR